ncbi:membrane bound O-acyl transferase family-domain-containing protein [Aspergillus ambiguus]|uniref:wax synthase family protein n=1 Tax=Aspergillus ambiguus TaxID=176160 RepID=UPI003CCD9F72
MVEYQTVSRLLFLSAMQILIPAVLVITTPKGSPLRYLSIPCMIWVLSLMLYPVEKPSYLAVNSAGGGWIGIISALDVLLINPKYAGDFVNADGKIQSLFSRLRSTLELMANQRKLNTPREAKNTPSPPKYYSKRRPKTITRGRFLIRETAIAVWQYLALDIFTLQAAKSALKKKEEEERVLNFSGAPENSRVELWIEQVITALVAWFVVTRILISFYYRSLSILCVALGLESPEMFPPLFNKMADAYTLRNFWGKFWHQNLRVNFTAVSNFITRKILGLPKPSVLERYTNVLLVFFLSGVLHITTDVVSNIPIRESGAMTFFLSFTVGYMIEDGVQAAWKQVHGSQKAREEPELWKKAIGFVWVVAFLAVTSTGYFRPALKRPESQVAMVPWSVAEIIGLDVVVGMVAFGGIFLKLVFKCEI